MSRDNKVVLHSIMMMMMMIMQSKGTAPAISLLLV